MGMDESGRIRGPKNKCEGRLDMDDFCPDVGDVFRVLHSTTEYAGDVAFGITMTEDGLRQLNVKCGNFYERVNCKDSEGLTVQALTILQELFFENLSLSDHWDYLPGREGREALHRRNGREGIEGRKRMIAALTKERYFLDEKALQLKHDLAMNKKRLQELGEEEDIPRSTIRARRARKKAELEATSRASARAQKARVSEIATA